MTGVKGQIREYGTITKSDIDEKCNRLKARCRTITYEQFATEGYDIMKSRVIDLDKKIEREQMAPFADRRFVELMKSTRDLNVRCMDILYPFIKR